MRMRFGLLLSAMAVLLLVGEPLAGDAGSGSIVRLDDQLISDTMMTVSIAVINDHALAAIDMPLRFGRPEDSIMLSRVEWSSRVAGWDVKQAIIDNENKTVILGLISDLTGRRKDSSLAPAGEGNASIATLVFWVQGQFRPSIETFTTSNPTHALTFIYNEYDRHGRPHVAEFTPDFQVDLTDD